MKKILLLCAALVFTSQASDFSMGVKAGVNFNNMKQEFGSEELDADSKIGFHVTGIADIGFNDFIGFQPGIGITTRGYKIDNSLMGFTFESKTNIFYLDIPLNFKGMYKMDALTPFVTAGPYLGIGLAGKSKITNEFEGVEEEEEEDVEWGDNGLKRFDFGLGFGAGVEIKSFVIGASFDLGLMNISNTEEVTVKNRSFKISAGYMF